jgi:hypothetical protein
MSIRYIAGRITESINPLRVPDAPATATATATAATTASIAFTAPADVGGSAVTNYFAVQTTGGTVFSSATSPISITGLTASTSYTFQVWALNTYGIGPVLQTNTITTSAAGTQKAIFGYGYNAGALSMTNLVSSTGVVSTDTTGVGTARWGLAAAGYGTDKAIFGYGYDGGGLTSTTNLVSNTGVVASNSSGVGTSRYYVAAAGYGTDKAIFGYGTTSFPGGTDYSLTNLVSNTGVVATNTTGVGTARGVLAATGYGTDKAIFGYGYSSAGSVSMTNLVSNTGVVATDTTGVGSARYNLAAAGYGGDKAIFYNGNTNQTNLVSNTGVVASNSTPVGTRRSGLAGAIYGSDKAIFGYGNNGSSTFYLFSNLVDNTGVVAADTTIVGTARNDLAAAGYSLT